MLDPSWNIHLTFRLPDDLLAFIHKKYQPFHRYEGQQTIKTSSISSAISFKLSHFVSKIHNIDESKITVKEWHWTLSSAHLATLPSQVASCTLLTFIEQMITLTTTS